MTDTPLSVLDLVPVVSGCTPGGAIRNSLELVRATESYGYHRYWFAEHHLNPGVAGTSPAVLLAMAAAASTSIRLGSGAVQMGHRTALATVEEFGLLDAAHPGRSDLGLGRSGGAPPPRTGHGRTEAHHTPEGLLLPAPVSLSHLVGSPRFAMQRTLLQLPDATSQPYSEQVDDLLALLAGTYRSDKGIEGHVVPGEGADLEVWILGSSGGESAQVAGRRGLRFAANYHVSPSSVVDAVAAYREAFIPSAALDRPHVMVSADVVVAEDHETARHLASGYGLWVLSIRSGTGAIPFPTPEEAARHEWTDDERALVEDRTATQFVGSAAQVADQLEVLGAATGADELLITTITHGHADRLRSYELLAKEWNQR